VVANRLENGIVLLSLAFFFLSRLASTLFNVPFFFNFSFLNSSSIFFLADFLRKNGFLIPCLT